MHRVHRVAAATVTLGVATAMALTGCSSSSDSASSSTTTTTTTSAQMITDPAALLTASSEATAALSGTHLVLSVDGKIPNLKATKVDADLATKPAKSGKGEATLIVGGKTVTAPFVYVDGHLYANVADAGYIDYGDGHAIYDVSLILDRDKGLPSVLRQVKNPAKAGEETIGGVTTTKVGGVVPAAALTAVAGTALSTDPKATLPVTLWITADGKNNLARLEVAPAPNAKLTVELSDWNKTVSVSKPGDIKTPSAKPSQPPAPGQPTREPAGG